MTTLKYTHRDQCDHACHVRIAKLYMFGCQNITLISISVLPELYESIKLHNALLSGLQIIDLILGAQPEVLVRASADQINLLVDACFKIKQQNLVDHLARALRKIYVMYSPTSPNNPAKVMQSHCLKSTGCSCP